MARDFNKLLISGRVVREIDRRECDNGKPVADFVLISNRKQLPKDDPDRSRYATAIKVTLWGEDAEYWSNRGLLVGDEVFVSGMVFSDDFQPKDGPRTSGRIRIDNVESVKLLKQAVRNRSNEDYE